MRALSKAAKRTIEVLITVVLIAGVALGLQTLTPSIENVGHKTNAAGASELEPATVERVVDGDTIMVTLNDQEQYVRLIGVDTPESVHPDESRNTEAGATASAYTESLLPEGSTVYLQKDTSDTDKYDRLLRYVWLEEPTSVNDESEVKSKMLNAILIQNGYAQAKPYEPDTTYADLFNSLESTAQQASFSIVPVYSQHIIDTGETIREIEYYADSYSAAQDQTASQDWREPIREAASDINLLRIITAIVVIFGSICLIGLAVYLLKVIYEDRRTGKALSNVYTFLYLITAAFALIVGFGMLFFAVIFMIP